jgi:hypothetical protein
VSAAKNRSNSFTEQVADVVLPHVRQAEVEHVLAHVTEVAGIETVRTIQEVLHLLAQRIIVDTLGVRAHVDIVIIAEFFCDFVRPIETFPEQRVQPAEYRLPGQVDGFPLPVVGLVGQYGRHRVKRNIFTVHLDLGLRLQCVELVVEPRDLPARITPEHESVQVSHSQTLVVPRRFPAVAHVHDQVFVLEDTAVAGVDALRVDVVLLA